MPGGPLPAGEKCDGSPVALWAGPNPADKTNILDVWSRTTAGRIVHWWLRQSDGKWYGPEFFG